MRCPKPVHLKLPIELTRQPARSFPLPRAMQLHRLQPHLFAIPLCLFGHAPIGGERPQASVLLFILVNGLNHSTPCLTLVIVDLAQIEYWSLHHFTASTALALHYAPIAVLFAIFDASCESQVHADGFYGNRVGQKDSWSSLHT